MKLSLREIARLLGFPADSIPLAPEISTLLTDSRSLLDPESTLFFAIPTLTNTGARYIPDLYERGVRAFVVARSMPKADLEKLTADCPDATLLAVDDPVKALQTVATRRDARGGQVVAITGSVGKTTLKEWLFQLLEPLREIARSPRSYNSQIGVPLSMWEISDSTDLTLIEAGVSECGEMKALADCIAPDMVIITDITRQHDSGFPDHAAKIAEKVSLAAAPTVGKIFYCADDPQLSEAVENVAAGRKTVTWTLGSADAFLRILSVDTIPGADSRRPSTSIRFSFGDSAEEHTLALPLTEEPDLRNAFHALSFMLEEGYSLDVIARRFACLHPIATRLSVSDGGQGCQVVYDSYTSDFSSLVPAVDFIMRRKVPGQRAIVVMSDLRHESRAEIEDYSRIAELMRRRGVDLFVGVGPRLLNHAHLFRPQDLFFPDTQSLAAELRTNLTSDAVVLLKGAPEFDFMTIKEVLEERTHETVLEVNLDAMIRNYNYFKSHLPTSTGMIAMVKAFGYGAGSYEIAKTLQDAGAAYLAVAVLDEGIALRKRGITMPIMVMNPRVADYAEMFSNRLQPEIYTLEMLREVISQAARNGVRDYPIHIKLDTGMHRMGFLESELQEVVDIIRAQGNVRISTAFSHLATADCPDLDDYTQRQLDTFERASSFLLENIGYHFRRHILNSAGILRYPEYHYDFARLGIGLYGINTLPPEMEKPLSVVSSLKTGIINLREWPAGTSVGYACKGILDHDATIATIPIGYADGMSRRFGNGNIKVLVNGREAPTIGNICMDACMIDVTGIDCAIGDRVEIFGENMSVDRLAECLTTIPYEILTSVSPRVKRVYFRE
ncbi:MAG: bifunctional UDP-N-acetylmuramoyl-tripeptide:D-alanyl-D-alanine ligase/alanine racemase [Muribaculaceae bacterium]|nr:bifunctional UDP-N-acetylmuramoyl-tripeptide:D-alanyl-D-alanine ligase/alanine racemase [Muribaculaceae bacterium]